MNKHVKINMHFLLTEKARELLQDQNPDGISDEEALEFEIISWLEDIGLVHISGGVTESKVKHG